jgi:type II secretion system protein H
MPSDVARARKHGFSLIELLLVLVIMGVAAALSLPRIARTSNQAKLHRAAQALQMDVQQAFAIAARNRAPVLVRWNSSKMVLELTNLAGSTVYRRSAIGAGAGYGLVASEVSVAPTALVVFPNGLAADTLRIALARNGLSKTLRVSKAGMSRLQ